MKEYSLLHRKKASPSGRPILIGLFLTVILSTALFFFSPSLRARVMALGAPLWTVEQAGVEALETVPLHMKSKAALIEEVEALRERASHAEIVLRRFSILENENQHLKGLLGRQAYESAVLASVLGRPPQTPYDTFLIDLGEHTAAVGDRVVVEGSVVIGTISEVYGRSAQVLLFSAPGVETAALVGPQLTPVTARGQGGGSFIAEFPRDIEVHEGDSVVLPGVNPHLFATVESVEAAPSDPFVTIRFKNPLNLQSVVWVQVITDASEEPPFEDPVPQRATSTPASATTSEDLPQ